MDFAHGTRAPNPEPGKRAQKPSRKQVNATVRLLVFATEVGAGNRDPN